MALCKCRPLPLLERVLLEALPPPGHPDVALPAHLLVPGQQDAVVGDLAAAEAGVPGEAEEHLVELETKVHMKVH